MRPLEDPDSPILPNEHDSTEGQGTSSGSQDTQGREGKRRSAVGRHDLRSIASFMMFLYLVLRTTLWGGGMGGLYTPGEFTDP